MGEEGREFELDGHRMLRSTRGDHVPNDVCIVWLSHVGTLLVAYLETEWVEEEIL